MLKTMIKTKLNSKSKKGEKLIHFLSQIPNLMIALALTLTLLFSLHIEASTELVTVKEGLSVEITKDGFSQLGEGLKNILNKQTEYVRVPNQGVSIPLVANFVAQDITFQSTLGDLQFAPLQGGLAFRMNFNDLRLRFGNVGVSHPFLPFLQNRCEGTEIVLGGETPLPVSGILKLDYVNGRVNVSLNRFNFNIKNGQFSVYGPTDCYGPFGFRSELESFIISGLLSYIKPFLNLTLGYQLQLFTKFAEVAINNLGNLTIPITVPELMIIPKTTINLGATPTALKVNESGLFMKLSVRLRREVNDQKALPKSAAEELGARLGTIGVNPTLINELLKELLKKGSLPLKVTKETSSDMAALLSRRELSVFWPDLNEVPSESDEMRVEARIMKAPTLTPNWNEGKMGVDLPSILLTFQIVQKGVWINYFDLKLALKTDLKIEIGGGKISLRPSDPTFSFEGSWATGYKPTTSTFNKEGVESLFTMIFSALVTSPEPVSFNTPIIPFDPYKLTIDNLVLEKPYLKLDLISLKQK